MPKNRIGRINEEIQKELSALLRTVKDPRISQGLVSITSVETTGDLRYAKVRVSTLDEKDENELMKGLRSASGYLRRELGTRLSLRYTPELIFSADESIRHGARISEILKTLGTGEDRDDGLQ